MEGRRAGGAGCFDPPVPQHLNLLLAGALPAPPGTGSCGVPGHPSWSFSPRASAGPRLSLHGEGELISICSAPLLATAFNLPGC